MSRLCLTSLALVALRAVGLAAAGGAFLEPGRIPDPLQLPELLDEFAAALGSEHRQSAGSRLNNIAAALSDTFAALPKNQRGAVGAASARYAVHRYFMQRHGWQIQGLAPQGESWSSSSPALALEDRVPGDFLSVFEERVGAHGLDLNELAVLAATLENMIHGEAVGRLEAIYRVLGRAPEDSLGHDEAAGILDTYMQAYVVGYNISTLTREQVGTLNRKISEIFPPWPQLKDFLREAQREAAPGLSRLAFADVARIAETVSERYGRFQDAEDCEDIRSRLVKLEEASGTGRVKLVDFYASVMKHGNWQFREHPELLKQMGALDDTDPSVPRVIIPNYVYTPSNCLNPASAFYAICCRDMCEELMDHVESKIRDPFARPEKIVDVVSALPSASVSAPRTLPAALVRKLQEVAVHHNGLVPLHSRLFAQWMHFAYPRECQYPHISGTTLNTTTKEWAAATGLRMSLSNAEVEAYVESQSAASKKASTSAVMAGDGEDEADVLCSAMWTPDEELIDVEAWRTAHSERQLTDARSSPRSVLCAVAMAAAVVSLVLILKEQLCFVLAHREATQGGAQWIRGGEPLKSGISCERKAVVSI